MFSRSNKQLLVVPITPAANCPLPDSPVCWERSNDNQHELRHRGPLFKCKISPLLNYVILLSYLVSASASLTMKRDHGGSHPPRPL